MAIKSFADVKTFFNDFVSANNIAIGTSPHDAFWNTSYDDFVDGNVPNVQDGLGNPVKILVKEISATSNIITILKGPLPGVAKRMPIGGPFMSAAQIADLAAWIDNKCPK